MPKAFRSKTFWQSCLKRYAYDHIELIPTSHLLPSHNYQPKSRILNRISMIEIYPNVNSKLALAWKKWEKKKYRRRNWQYGKWWIKHSFYVIKRFAWKRLQFTNYFISKSVKCVCLDECQRTILVWQLPTNRGRTDWADWLLWWTTKVLWTNILSNTNFIDAFRMCNDEMSLRRHRITNKMLKYVFSSMCVCVWKWETELNLNYSIWNCGWQM